MSLSLDPRVAAGLAAITAAAGDAAPPPPGDVATRRAQANGLLGLFASQLDPHDEVTRTSYTVDAEDGTALELTWYAPPTGATGAAVLYVHGGGMILGSVELYDRAIAGYVADSDVPALAVEYRLAPEHPHPVPVEDCYTAVRWLADHAAELGVDPARIAVMGDSAGGGLAAGVALLAHDRGGPALAAQLLVYPMLDDRTTVPDPEIAPMAVWTYEDNITGWGALLGDAAGAAEGVPEYAAPARRADLRGLPPTYLDVGQIDIFRDEDVRYALALSAAGVPVELHVLPGAPHAYEGIAPDGELARRTHADRIRRLRAL